MNGVAIRVQDLRKRYRLGQRVEYGALRDAIAASIRPRRGRRGAPRREEIWALGGVSFDVARGDVLGILGDNGAGKSTLLKILSRITEPTSGRAEIRGTVAALIEVGTGFHPELTGRENVFLNGSILGMRRAEIAAKLDEIVAFAEVERFLDTPLKFYSTGMAVRLGFAVAAHLEPEVLLVDEVLSVGDVAFQRKCIGKIGDVASTGRTVLFVSHNLPIAARLCTRAILLESGLVRHEGPAAEVVQLYLAESPSEGGVRTWSGASEGPFEPISLTLGQRGVATERVDAREPLEIELVYDVRREIPDLLVEITIQSSDGTPILTARDRDDPEVDERFAFRPPGRYRTVCVLPPDLFGEGRFSVRLRVFRPKVEHYVLEDRAASFTVFALGGIGSHPDAPARGPLRPRLEWEVEHEPLRERTQV